MGQRVTTFAGSGVYGEANGPASTAQFEFPDGIAVDSAGNVYVADQDAGTIRKITPAGVVTTIAGGLGYGFVDGSGSSAEFEGVTGITIDPFGNIYVADEQTIRKLTPAS